MTLESAVLIASRSSGDTVPTRRRIARVDGRSKAARRVKNLIASYARRLGEAANNPIVHGDIVRLAEMETLTDDQRAAALRHEPVDLMGLNRLENTARRMRAALGLDGLPPPPPVPHRELYPLILVPDHD